MFSYFIKIFLCYFTKNIFFWFHKENCYFTKNPISQKNYLYIFYLTQNAGVPLTKIIIDHLLHGAVQSPQKRPIFLRAFSATFISLLMLSRPSSMWSNCSAIVVVIVIVIIIDSVQTLLNCYCYCFVLILSIPTPLTSNCIARVMAVTG